MLGTVTTVEGKPDLDQCRRRRCTDLLAPPVAAALPVVPGARVARIDPALADTAAFLRGIRLTS